MWKGIAMEPEMSVGVNPEDSFCPECGAEEGGYFCRICGALVHGEDKVLCPRCHHVVPGGEFCNQCGQNLGSIALNLQQLALAGDDFWITASASAAPAVAPAGSPSSAELLLAPDDSVMLADAELPDWLQELPIEEAPAEVQEHIYPSLQPIEEDTRGTQQGRFLFVVGILMVLMLLSIVALVLMLLMQGGG